MHPYAHHKDHKVAKHRVGKIMKSGGHAHSDEKADKKLFAGLMHEHESKMHHGKSHARLDKFARGGRTKAKGHVHINILNAPHGASSPTPSPMGLTGAAPPPGAMGPPIAPPPGMGGPPFPPPAAGGMGPPGMGHKRGGRIDGESNASNLKKWAKHASSNSPPKKAFAKGGKVPMKAGAISGEGRLEKKKAYGLTPKKAG